MGPLFGHRYVPVILLHVYLPSLVDSSSGNYVFKSIMSNSRSTFPLARVEEEASSEEQVPFTLPSTLSLESLHERDCLHETPTWFSRSWSLLASGVHRTRDVIQNNAGLLLVASSQAFFAMMNAAVKKLNNLDPPVSALEVRAVLHICIYY
jgi:hypothetical protein